MPITVNELEAQIEVAPGAGQAEAGQEDRAEAMQRWLDLAREQLRRDARTAAWANDD
uniref:hypothetical protein n=1 Tax=Cupriavidus yeoncheonensis TaxID=1462994 RepID=UPI003F4986C1